MTLVKDMKIATQRCTPASPAIGKSERKQITPWIVAPGIQEWKAFVEHFKRDTRTGSSTGGTTGIHIFTIDGL